MSTETHLKDAIRDFRHHEFITDVLGVISSGKEATVALCAAHASLRRDRVAMKVYRPETERSFTNQAVYLRGRFPTRRDAQALVRKRSFKGMCTRVDAWTEREFDLLRLLYDVGVAVPEPIVRRHDAIVMSFIGTDDQAAPRLRDVRLSPDDARRVRRQLLDDIEFMLGIHYVHGDLSGYNVLYHDEQPVIIDVPQAVDVRHNPDAFALLERDIRNVCHACGGGDVESGELALDLWNRYVCGLI